MRRNLLDSSPLQTLYKTCEFQEICGAEAAFAVGQCGESVLRRQVGPAQRNLTLPAFLIEKRDSVFAAVFFAAERLKLTTGQRMKGMDDSKFLGFYPTNACSATPFPNPASIPRTRTGRQARASTSGTLSSWLRLSPVPSARFSAPASSQTGKSRCASP